MAEAATVPDFVTIIQTVGFPIACCIGLFIYLIKTAKSHKEEVNELKEAIYSLKTAVGESMAQQNKELTQAINNNTLAMQRLTDKMSND